MFNFDSLLPRGLSLWPYQTCGVATALLERRIIIGDEMGLGKSVQALITIESCGQLSSCHYLPGKPACQLGE